MIQMLGPGRFAFVGNVSAEVGSGRAAAGPIRILRFTCEDTGISAEMPLTQEQLDDLAKAPRASGLHVAGPDEMPPKLA